MEEGAVEESLPERRRKNDVSIWEKRFTLYLLTFLVGYIATNVMSFKEDFTQFKTEFSVNFKNLSLIVDRHEKAFDKNNNRFQRGELFMNQTRERLVKLETRAEQWVRKGG